MSVIPIWKKSSFSEGEGANCIELARRDGRVLIRESDAPHAILTAAPARLGPFLAAVKAGRFDGLGQG
ncbi:hypothetical protein SBI_06975 [Streptomyces bingchenggensis BCW-1]|uniref:DUF397 domain-containing protein n=1 Tax=Streptomyces bingchenggensis (strain BCW-1) TaxID=749414 RepID=D7C1N0_STRBB|nr:MULTISPECIES: DUF397 domain-containing protein [Streptomyces]ADI10095.1 hypothetical protein SBI_06975 [Streptomyces bingchenggensis BCW-1]